jgi:hypothetical protein
VKHALKLTGIAGLIMGAAILLNASPAEADNAIYGGYMGDQDSYAYWNYLDSLFGGDTDLTVSTAKDFGLTMCKALQAGASEGKLVSFAIESHLPRSAVRLAIHGAEFHYCPEYY